MQGNSGFAPNWVIRANRIRMETEAKPADQVPKEEKKTEKKKNYRKDKPWDGDHIDHWKIEVGVSVAKGTRRNGRTTT